MMLMMPGFWVQSLYGPITSDPSNSKYCDLIVSLLLNQTCTAAGMIVSLSEIWIY